MQMKKHLFALLRDPEDQDGVLKKVCAIMFACDGIPTFKFEVRYEIMGSSTQVIFFTDFAVCI